MLDTSRDKKIVRFDENVSVRRLLVWPFAHHAARVGEWEMAARDRLRFTLRIERAAVILESVLLKKINEAKKGNLKLW